MAKTKEEVQTPPPLPTDGIDLDALRQAQGAGRENIKEGRDTQIPFLQIVQKGSPCADREHGKYIPGCVPGDIINTVTNKIYRTYEPNGKPLIVTLVGFVHVWVEWKMRHLGGGFIKNHKDEMILARTRKGGPKGKDDILIDTPENHIVSTAMHSVLTEDEDGRYPAVISMTSTQLKKSRKWMSQIGALKDPRDSSIELPIFYKKYELRTVSEKFAEGSAYGWSITMADTVSKDLFKEAFDSFKKMQSQNVLPAPPQTDDDFEPNFLPESESPKDSKSPM